MSGPLRTFPLPSFYDPADARKSDYDPDIGVVMAVAEDYRRANGIKPGASDAFQLGVLDIDNQKSFCFPDGSLYVGGRSGTGAMDDSQRGAEWTYRNIGYITDIWETFDTHLAFQIFFAPFWENTDGQMLSPHTLIMLDGDTLVNVALDGTTILHRNVRPRAVVASLIPGLNGNLPWLINQVKHYCRELAKAKKYTLYLWPPHCILGSKGHSLVGVIQAARMFHAFVRGRQSNNEIKGAHPLFENYSIFGGEVRSRFDGQPMTQKNVELIKKLHQLNALVIKGQASSHCVLSSIDDFLMELLAVDPALARKVYILRDCTSAVAVPNPAGGFFADFTPQAEAAFDRFANAGMNVVLSTTPIEEWPNMQIAA